MAKRILVVFTFRSVDQLLAEGGSQAWALNAANARRCSFIVCTRNRHRENAVQQEEHGAAFLVGKISGVEPSPEDPARYIVRFDRYALLVDPQPVVWPGARNPVWYVDDFRDIKIDESALEWLPVPESRATKYAAERPLQDLPALGSKLTIAEAKAGLAATFGVSPEHVEITIRG